MMAASSVTVIHSYTFRSCKFYIKHRIILRIRSGKKIHLDEGSRLPLHGYQNPDLAGFGRSGYRRAGSLFEIAILNRLLIPRRRYRLSIFNKEEKLITAESQTTQNQHQGEAENKFAHQLKDNKESLKIDEIKPPIIIRAIGRRRNGLARNDADFREHLPARQKESMGLGH